MTVHCQIERFTVIAHEIAQLVDPHWEEVGSFRDEFYREIDYASYQKLENEKRLLTVAARAGPLLVGYYVGVLGLDLHRVTKTEPSQRVKVCNALVYYIAPAWRGYALSLIRATERAAVALGCQIISTRVKPEMNRADAFFSKIGYSPVEVVMTKLIGDADHAPRGRPPVP